MIQRRRNAFFLFLSAAISVLPLAAEEAPITGTLTSGGKPVAGAVVRLTAVPDLARDFELRFSGAEPAELARVKSGPDGVFALAGPAEGLYRLAIAAEGYLAGELFIFFDPEEASKAELRLAPARRVKVTVMGPDGPVAGARIRAQATIWPAFTATAADGGATLAIAQGAAVDLWVVAEGFAPQKVSFAAEGPDQATVALASGRPLALAVVDATRGRPLEGVVVVQTGSGLALGRTGPDGKAVVQLGPGATELAFIDAAGHRQREPLPEPLPAGGQPVRVELEDPLRLHGQVLELPGRNPLAGAWVYAAGRMPLFTRSGRDGTFALEVPRDWSPQLTARKRGFRKADTELPALSAELTLGLAGAARLEGRVRDSAGRAVAGARVLLKVAGERRFSDYDFAATDADGRFVFRQAMVDGELELQATADDGRQSPLLRVAALATGQKAQADLVIPRADSWTCRIVDPAGAAIAGAEVVAAPESNQFSGMIYDEMADWPRFRSRYPSGVSDAAGVAAVSLAAGAYDVAVRAAGFGPLLRRGLRVRSPAGEAPAPPEQLELQPAVRASGKVTDDRGRGVAGAELRPRLAKLGSSTTFVNELPSVVATSGKDGDFTFAEVAEGQAFDLVATKEGYASALLASAVMIPGEPLVVEMIRAGRLHGTATSLGKPVPELRISLERLDRPELWRQVDGRRMESYADARGLYAIEGLAPGSYQVVAGELPGFQSFRGAPFEIAAGESRTLDLEIAKASVIFGRVLLSNGEPVAMARVGYGPGAAGGARPIDFAQTDGLGGYRLETVSQGPGWLEVEADGHRSLVREVVVEEGETQVDLTLAAGKGSLIGRVVGPDGEPIAGARVSLAELEQDRAARSNVASRATGRDGTAHFEALESSIYHLDIEKPGYVFGSTGIEVEDGANRLEWQMQRASGRLSGALLGLEPAEIADLSLRAKTPSGLRAQGHLEGNGYAIEALAAGRWTVTAWSARGGLVLVQVVELAEGQPEVVQDLDFRGLAGPWRAEIRRDGQPLRGLRYSLATPEGRDIVGNTSSGTGRIVLRAAPGTYLLGIFVLPDFFRRLPIEIGAPSDQVIDVDNLPAPQAGHSQP